MSHGPKKSPSFQPATLQTPYHLMGNSKTTRFLIVCPNRFQRELLKTVLENEFAIPVNCYEQLTLQSVIDSPTEARRLYMLDCLDLSLNTVKGNLEIQSAHVPDHILIVLYNVTAEIQFTPLVKPYQVRGLFSRNDSKAMFIKGIRMILDGHLWLTRRILSLCIRSTLDCSRIPAASAEGVKMLSGREIEILQYVAHGKSNQEVADAMLISLHTVKSHLYNIYRKIKVSNRLQAVSWATTCLETNAES